MLTLNPKNRITAEQALKVPWICVKLFIIIIFFKLKFNI